MSGQVAYNIPTFSPADYQDDDTYGEDCTLEMTARGTTIASIGVPKVSRTDGRAVGYGDMAISGLAVIAAGMKFVWKGLGGYQGVGYYITFPLTLNDGDVINRTVLVPVPQYVG